MPETFRAMVARVNGMSFIPPPDPTGAIMAKPVKLNKGKEFMFKSSKGGGASKYPWDQWLNGDLLLLEQSVGTKDDKGTVVAIGANKGDKRDFEVDAQAMRGKCKTAARKRYRVCEISYRDADGHRLTDSLIIRSREMLDSEKTAEDLLRAEEKQEAIARRKAQQAQRAQPTPDEVDLNLFPAPALATGTA